MTLRIKFSSLYLTFDIHILLSTYQDSHQNHIKNEKTLYNKIKSG